MSPVGRVVVYVDEETGVLDLASAKVDPGVVLEVRQWCKDGTRRFSDPVVTEVRSSGVTSVDTRIEP